MPNSDLRWDISPLPPRALAVFVDYLVSVLVVLCVQLSPIAGDYQFLVLIAFGAIYFGVGNSSIMGGQTLGKRAFGLRTVRAHAATFEYISLPRSLLRYGLLYGVLILVVELPPLVFRALEVSGSPQLLELHMLGLLSYSCFNFFLVLAARDHRGIHDLISGSCVVRLQDLQGEPQGTANGWLGYAHSKKLHAYCSLLGGIFGLLFWVAGTSRPATIRPIFEHRYVIEHRLPLRITGIVGTSEDIQLEGITAIATTELKSLAAEATELLLALGLLTNVSSTVRVQFELLSLTTGTESSSAAPFELKCYASRPQTLALELGRPITHGMLDEVPCI